MSVAIECEKYEKGLRPRLPCFSGKWCVSKDGTKFCAGLERIYKNRKKIKCVKRDINDIR